MQEDLPTINRGVITVIPRQPFYDWINSLDPKNPLSPEKMTEYNAYLIREDFVDPIQVVKKYYKAIFEEELFGMWTEEDDWPDKRTYKKFQEWFEVKVASMVFDLEKRGIVREIL